jgi:hypothetical protein
MPMPQGALRWVVGAEPWVAASGERLLPRIQANTQDRGHLQRNGFESQLSGEISSR